MAKNNTSTHPDIGIGLADMLREATTPSVIESENRSDTPSKEEPLPSTKELPGHSRSWQHFSVICDKSIVSKIHAIAKNEGFSVREVVEYLLSAGIASYEGKHGEVKECPKSMSDVF